jgi:hypothetical protein
MERSLNSTCHANQLLDAHEFIGCAVSRRPRILVREGCESWIKPTRAYAEAGIGPRHATRGGATPAIHRRRRRRQARGGKSDGMNGLACSCPCCGAPNRVSVYVIESAARDSDQILLRAAARPPPVGLPLRLGKESSRFVLVPAATTVAGTLGGQRMTEKSPGRRALLPSPEPRLSGSMPWAWAPSATAAVWAFSDRVRGFA